MEINGIRYWDKADREITLYISPNDVEDFLHYRFEREELVDIIGELMQRDEKLYRLLAIFIHQKETEDGQV